MNSCSCKVADISVHDHLPPQKRAHSLNGFAGIDVLSAPIPTPQPHSPSHTIPVVISSSASSSSPSLILESLVPPSAQSATTPSDSPPRQGSLTSSSTPLHDTQAP
eukprot:TRINITY_DN20858_c0_g1_i1.p1 TRINITY_DN20858_c0_g1~~TRINITY_DN20858_c0_g1_i1.p1  ORF type:complete len:120 (+),score=33.08 TRINITY_DN20858_c0_g1_i1:44-361(+)